MPLTNTKIKNAKPRPRNYKLGDEKGLYLLVTPAGAKYWRVKYRYAKKERTYSIGVYPEISLKEARTRCDEARKELSQGIDPSQAKQSRKIEKERAHNNSFRAVALDWNSRKGRNLSPATLKKRMWILNNHIFPQIGSLPISEITPPQVLRALRKIESRGTLETAQRAKQTASQVFRYGVATGVCDTDPTRDLLGALTPKKINHHAALTNPDDVGELLGKIKSYSGSIVTCSLLRLSPILFQRPGEMRKMEWAELDLESKRWEIPAEKMKMGIPHIVPLPKQAMKILNDLFALTGRRKYVFTSNSNPKRPVSDGTVNKALRIMGYSGNQMTAHGFRAMARTILDEVLEFAPFLIEQQISHAVRDPLGRAYNRTAHLKQRTVMMQRWADYLDQLVSIETGENIVALRSKLEANR